MFEAIVIGGGPAGSTVATLLARRGRRVVLLEKERFPRFHVGESLLPTIVTMLEKLGIKDQVDGRFLRKNAAEFVTADGSLKRRYPFSESLVPGPSFAWEVERAAFDQILLDAAIAAGADVRQGVEVTSFTASSSEVEVTTRDGRITGKVLIDASGQRSLLASRLGLREMDKDLKNAAVLSHFRGAERHSGDCEGDITIVLAPVGWWWIIPLDGDLSSVGYITPTSALAGRKMDQAFFEEQMRATPYVAERLKNAERAAPVRTTSDYSFTSREFAGDGWLLMGDAAAFIDPVFSTGVVLGMEHAFRAAEAVDRALERGRTSRRAFRDYASFVARSVDSYGSFVKGFYTPEFVELLMYPNDRFDLRRGITALLAGHALDRGVVWRSLLFRSLARANRVVELVPRIPERR
jgi:flavin-dependent dehydrogenase